MEVRCVRCICPSSRGKNVCLFLLHVYLPPHASATAPTLCNFGISLFSSRDDCYWLLILAAWSWNYNQYCQYSLYALASWD